MHSMHFSAAAGLPRFDRAGALAITVLVHVVILAALLVNAAREQGLRAPDGDTNALFTLLRPLSPEGAAPARRGVPAAAPSATVAAGVAGAAGAGQAGLAGANTASLPAPPERTPAGEEIPRALPPQAAGGAGPTAEPASAAPAAPAGTSSPVAPPATLEGPPVMVQVPAGESGDDSRKTIILQTMGSSVGTYIFPGLTGINAQNETQLFRVETGVYPDLETAVINDIIRRIRARFPEEIKWDSVAQNRIVTLSMRVEDHDALVQFLRLELFDKRRKVRMEAGSAAAMQQMNDRLR